MPAPVASQADVPRRITATGRSGAILITSVLRERAVDRDARDRGKRAKRAFDLVRVDRHEAAADEIPGGAGDVPLERRRSTFDLYLVEREDRGRIGHPVGDADRDEQSEGDEQRAAGGDEAHEIQASTGRTSRKRDDDACRSSMPTRSRSLRPPTMRLDSAQRQRFLPRAAETR